MTLSTDVDRRCTDEEYLEAAYWGMQANLAVLKQANERMNQQLALECGRRFAYWQERAIAFASRRQSWTKAG
jgi:non-ribosomal peptide synthetase component E (peptide arylation enzyme)